MTQVLDAYPKVKGMQVMNDMGQYMYSQYSGKWIPDTPGRRKAVIARLRSWNVFSNSSPVEGINARIRTFADPRQADHRSTSLVTSSAAGRSTRWFGPSIESTVTDAR